MKFHRLRITNFGAIDHEDVELGPGLNVLYGPNHPGNGPAVRDPENHTLGGEYVYEPFSGSRSWAREAREGAPLWERPLPARRHRRPQKSPRRSAGFPSSPGTIHQVTPSL